MKTVISAPPNEKSRFFKIKNLRNFQFSALFSFFKVERSKRTFQKALLWKPEAGAKFWERRKPVGKGKAR